MQTQKTENEIKWTGAQLAAINVKANRVLVSAAAGSGKSTVLTERIITSITRDKAPCDLQNLLIVTFTRASADDLKEKITRALSKKIALDPENKHLAKQMLKLPSAKINTIHGVCFSFIKQYFEYLKLPASVSIIDDNSAASLRTEVMTRFIDQCYLGTLPAIPDFDSFCENFVTERDEKLSDMFLTYYDKMKNLPNGFDRFDSSIFAENGNGFMKTPFGKKLFDKYLIALDYYYEVFTKALNFAVNDDAYRKFADDFSDALEFTKRLINAIKSGDFSLLYKITSSIPERARKPLSSSLKTAEGELYRQELKALYATAEAWHEQIFCYSDEMIASYSKKTKDISYKLFEFLREFDKRFSEAKLRRSFIDFSDLEHYMIRLLYNKNGEISEIAKSISSSLDEIYVDECQDLSPIQTKIFDALSVFCPIFMVGDIKQSIYGFRGGDSSAFSHYKRSFPEYSGEKEYDDVTVFLSENFRSGKSVIDFSNAVSDAMFITKSHPDGILSYRIPYSPSDRLVCGRTDIPECPVTLLNCVPDKDNAKVAEKASTDLEAEMVANEINELISSGVKPSSIAILLRTTSTNAPIFESKLKKRGIPVSTKKGSLLFDTPEVQLALCLLNVCDNPYRDIFLTGALRSPIFGVTLDELIKIKTGERGAKSLYDALVSYTEKNSFEKGIYFLDFLERMRKFAMENTVDRLLWQIYTETSFFSLIYDGTVSEDDALTRRGNLLKLHELAHELCYTGQNDLYSFIEKIRLLIEQDRSPKAYAKDSDGVKIMTIHASKGLEFEYCFVSCLSSTLTNQDLYKDIIFDNEIGFSAKLKDDLRITKSETPHRAALRIKMEYEWLDEEMRLLYVALTRAQKKLYLTSSVRDIYKLNEEMKALSIIDHPFNMIRHKSYLKWILIALNKLSVAAVNFELKVLEQDSIYSSFVSKMKPSNQDESSVAPLTATEYSEILSTLKERICFTYPFEYSLLLPSKLSVSRLYPEILDEEEYYGSKTLFSPSGELQDIEKTDTSQEEIKDNSSLLKVPDFMLGAAHATSADRGTATHVFMQFCDFDNLSKNGVDAEISRLVEKRFILSYHAELINKSVIESFLKSDIFSKMSASAEINREYRFNIKLPASDFTSNDELKTALAGESIFVQGIIDCYFKDENGDIILLDYKTDHVPYEIKGDKKREDQFFISRHRRQLSYYRSALEILCSSKVSRTLIFSFDLGRCIEVY